MPTGSLGKRTPEPPLLAAMSPRGPRPPTLSLAPRPQCRAAGAVMTTAAMPLVAVLSLRTTVSAVPVALISAAFIIIPLWHSPPGCVPTSQREESSAGALCPQGTLGSVWRHSGCPSQIGDSGHYHVGAGKAAGRPVMHRAAPSREPSGAEWRWGVGLPARLGQAPQSFLDTLAGRLGCCSALPLPAVF